MHNLGDSPAISSAQFLQREQILAAKIQAKLQSNFESIGAIAVQIANGAGDLSVAVRRFGGGLRGGGGIQSEALDILALQGSRLELIGHGGRQENRRNGSDSSRRWWGDERQRVGAGGCLSTPRPKKPVDINRGGEDGHGWWMPEETENLQDERS